MFGAETWVVLVTGLAGALIVTGVAWWLRDRGSEPEDLTIGFLGPSLAALYLLVLAVALATEWQTIGNATSSAATEASAVRQLYWSASGLPQAQATQVRQQTLAYADAVVDHDWPQMQHGYVDDQTERMLTSLNGYVLGINPPTAQATNAQLAAITQLSSMFNARDQRATAAGTKLPLGLVAGVIATSCVVAAFPFIGGIRTSAASITVAAMQAALVAVGVVVVFQLNHVYSGPLAVTPAEMHSVIAELTGA